MFCILATVSQEVSPVLNGQTEARPPANLDVKHCWATKRFHQKTSLAYTTTTTRHHARITPSPPCHSRSCQPLFPPHGHQGLGFYLRTGRRPPDLVRYPFGRCQYRSYEMQMRTDCHQPMWNGWNLLVRRQYGHVGRECEIVIRFRRGYHDDCIDRTGDGIVARCQHYGDSDSSLDDTSSQHGRCHDVQGGFVCGHRRGRESFGRCHQSTRKQPGYVYVQSYRRFALASYRSHVQSSAIRRDTVGRTTWNLLKLVEQVIGVFREIFQLLAYSSYREV